VVVVGVVVSALSSGQSAPTTDGREQERHGHRATNKQSGLRKFRRQSCGAARNTQQLGGHFVAKCHTLELVQELRRAGDDDYDRCAQATTRICSLSVDIVASAKLAAVISARV
jgi:hypothetical protein